MKKIVAVSEFHKKTGFKFNWIKGYEVSTEINDEGINIKANKEGLESLAGILLALAGKQVPNNYHLHLDSYGSLEDGSVDLVIQKI
jgi:hypothetical protein